MSLLTEKDIHVTFYEEGHKYLDQFGNRYLSGTGIIGQYKSHFDANYWSRREAEKRLPNGLEFEIVLEAAKVRKEWEAKGKAACEKGTAYHLERELWVNSLAEMWGMPVILERPHISQLKDGLYTELTVWNYEYQIAGQADLVLIKDGYVKIGDYKTNKEIKRSNRYQKMNYPINHLDCCHMNAYALQTTIYQWMICQQTGYKPAPNAIFSTAENAWIPCKDMHMEFEGIRNHMGIKNKLAA